MIYLMLRAAAQQSARARVRLPCFLILITGRVLAAHCTNGSFADEAAVRCIHANGCFQTERN